MQSFIGFCASLSLLLFSWSALAAAPPVLEITGNITRFNDAAARVYRITDAQWRTLPQSSIRTSTTWTPRATFTGVRMTDLLALAGSRGTMVEFQTLDDYTLRIAVADFSRYGVVLARSMDGRLLRASDFGPWFLVYPRDDYPAQLRLPTTQARFVWQVTRMIVH